MTTGEADLDRAVRICEAHKEPSAIFYSEGGQPRNFAKGWEACHEVMAAWDRSATAIRAREAEEQAMRDRAFVNDFAKRIKKND